tara:strand:+ start:760 stop:1074 length:315 start_codon:yes stop_codon:yes gene_type:complete
MLDSHFEVILERVKELSEISGTVVWFEVYETLTLVPIMILINDKNSIAMTVLDDNKEQRLYSYKLLKHEYEELVDDNFNLKNFLLTEPDEIDTSIAVKWVTDTK